MPYGSFDFGIVAGEITYQSFSIAARVRTLFPQMPLAVEFCEVTYDALAHRLIQKNARAHGVCDLLQALVYLTAVPRAPRVLSFEDEETVCTPKSATKPMGSEIIELVSEELCSSEEMRVVDPRSEFDYSSWGTINCQRTDEGTWKIWFKFYMPGYPKYRSETCDETSGIKDARQFLTAFLQCGVEIGSHPDLGSLEAALPSIAAEDAQMASELQALLD